MDMRESLADLKDPLHLGDGLYVGHDDFGVWLKAERYGMIHEVYVEPSVFRNLTEYVKRMQAASAAQSDAAMDEAEARSSAGRGDEDYPDTNDND